MHIKDLVVLFHVWLKKPSLQIQSDVQEVNNFLVDSNQVQGEAIFPEDPVKFLSCPLCASGCLGGYCQPVVFVGSNIYVQMLELTEEVEYTDVTALPPIICTHCDVKVLGAFLFPNIVFIVKKE